MPGSRGAALSFRAVLDEATRARFIGRGAELALLRRSALEGSPALVWMSGAPGVGKTALAAMARAEADAAGLATHWLPAAPVSASPPAVRSALADIGLREGLAALGWGSRRDVLFLDGFEHLLAAAEWLFTCALPEAGANLSLVITCRSPMPRAIETHVGTGGLAQSLELSNFDRDETAALLQRHDIGDPRLARRVFELTRGHALAVTMLARNPRLRAELETLSRLPDAVIQVLARELSRDAPSPAHRDALAAIAITLCCDERMLGAMLGADPGGPYEWLRALPFVASTPWGLAPHDLIRDAVFADLEQRDPEKALTMSRAAIDELLRRMSNEGLDGQRRLALEGLYTRRSHPFIRDHLHLDGLRHTYVEAGRPSDAGYARASIARHEGDASAALFDLWYQTYPDHLFAVRDERAEPVAMYCYVPLSGETPEALRRDPVLRRAAEATRELAGDGGILVGRWWFGRDAYQDFGPAMSAAMFGGPMITASLRPIPRFSVTVTHGVERWRPLAPSTFMDLLPEGVVEVDGRELGLWLLDTHRVGSGCDLASRLLQAYANMLSSFAVMTDASLGSRDAPSPAEVPRAAPAPIPTSEIKAALRDLHRPHALASHPLAARASRASGEPDGAVALARAIDSTVAAMATSPAYEELAAILSVTYLRPRAKQVAAAMDLGLPWGTYRHRLRRAIEVLAAELARALR